MNNDDKFIRDLNNSQDFDERLNDLLANPDSSDDELAQLIDAVQDIRPPADFVAQLDAKLQEKHARRRNVRRLVRYGIPAAAAILVFVVAVVLLSGDDSRPGTDQTDVAIESTAIPQVQATNLPPTEIAFDPTTTPIETAISALSTATALPSDTATGTSTGTATTTSTGTPTPLPSPTVVFTQDALMQTATSAVVGTTSTAAAFPTATLPASPPPAHATQTINMTRIIDDNAEFEDYMNYRATVDNVEGLDVVLRFVVRVNSPLGTPIPGAVVNIDDVELRTNIDGAAYIFPAAYGLNVPPYETTVQDGDAVAGLVLESDDETVEVTLDSEQVEMPLDVALWVTEPGLRSEVENISIPGTDIRIIEDLNELTETPQLIILIAGSSPEPIEDYPEFLLDLPGVKIQTLAAAGGLDRETEFVWRQIAQFTGGIFIAYDPPFVLPDLITNLIEEELPQ